MLETRQTEQLRMMQEQINVLSKEYEACKRMVSDIENNYFFKYGEDAWYYLYSDRQWLSHLAGMYELEVILQKKKKDIIEFNEKIRGVEYVVRNNEDG